MNSLWLISVCLLIWEEIYQNQSLALRNISSYTPSCYNAANASLYFSAYCGFITWSTARLYETSELSMYSAGTPLTAYEQNDVAYNYADSLGLFADYNQLDNCKLVANWFACVDAFPYCPIFGYSLSSVSYIKPCRLHCEQVADLCNINDRNILNCDKYSEDSCVVYVSDEYTFFPPKRGPYSSMPFLYSTLCFVWGFTAALWVTYCFAWRKMSRPFFHHIILGLFFCRLSVALMMRDFWQRCTVIESFCLTELITFTGSILRILEGSKSSANIY